MSDRQPPLVSAHPRHIRVTEAGASHDASVWELRPPAGIAGRLWYLLGESDEIFIEDIKSEGHGWGSAMIMKLQAMHPERTRWTAESINVESEQFWDKMRSRHGIDLKAGAVRPDRRP